MSALNGPVTLTVVTLGTVLNTLTVYVLSTHTLLRNASTVWSCGSVRQSFHGGYASTNSSVRKGGRRAYTGGGGGNRPRLYTFLLWLVVSDTALLISALLMYSLPNLLGRYVRLYIHLFPALYFISNTALTASFWLMCTLIFDRYRALCRPFRVRSTTTGRIHKLLVAVYLFAGCFSIPRFFEIAVVMDERHQEYYLAQTDLVKNQFYMIGYRIVGGLLFYSLLPYVVLFILSLKVWSVLSDAAIGRRGMNARGNAQPSASSDSERVLIAMMTKFLFSRLMPTALDVIEHVIGPDNFTISQGLTICVDISNLIVVLASATDFVIFYSVSRSFRRSFSLLFACCKLSAWPSWRWRKRNLTSGRLPAPLLSTFEHDLTDTHTERESITTKKAEVLARGQDLQTTALLRTSDSSAGTGSED